MAVKERTMDAAAMLIETLADYLSVNALFLFRPFLWFDENSMAAPDGIPRSQ